MSPRTSWKGDKVDWSAVARDLDSAATAVVDSIIPIATNDPRAFEKVAAGSLICKAHTDFRAMLLLRKEGFPDSAQILERSVLEACLNLLYIVKEPSERARLFWAYGIHQRARLGEWLEKTSRHTSKMRAKTREFQEFVASRKKERWPLRLEDIVKALGPVWEERVHRLYYDSLSSNVHALPLTLENWYLSFRQAEVVVGRRVAETDGSARLAIVCLVFAAALDKGVAVLDLPTPEYLTVLGGILNNLPSSKKQ